MAIIFPISFSLICNKKEDERERDLPDGGNRICFRFGDGRGRRRPSKEAVVAAEAAAEEGRAEQSVSEYE